MTVYIVDIEAVDTRYTAQWKKHLPQQLRHALGGDFQQHVDVRVISGGDVPQTTDPGAFLNFAGTNSYKSQQMQEIAYLFSLGSIKNGDYFLYTDAWNPTVLQLKYMAELLGIKIKIGGMWHAGSYDPADFLGRLVGDAPWVRTAERSMFETYDHNYFATQFHIDMFNRNLLKAEEWQVDRNLLNKKVIRTGWPMEYMEPILEPFKDMEKHNLILFPHRIAPEKQINIFRDLAEVLPFKCIVCQDSELTKEEYHELLGTAKMVFSANLQETLGISCYEGALVNTIPLVPDRLSYSEMYNEIYKYPSDWTRSFEHYTIHKKELVSVITDIMHNYPVYLGSLPDLTDELLEFFHGEKLYNTISSSV